MESYHKMDIESLDRKMKEHTNILREIYLTMILLTIFIICLCIYLVFDKYYIITHEQTMSVIHLYEGQ